MAKYKAGFLGCGNMGGPMVQAAAKAIPPETIAVCGKTKVRADALAEKLGVISTTEEDIAAGSEYIFLCVKPQMFPHVFENIAPILKNRPDRFVLVSPAAGLTLDSIAVFAEGGYPIIRCMPNTPVAVESGTTTFCVNSEVTEAEKQEFKDMMRYSGILDELAEEQMNAGCSLAGCGPAFVFLFIDAMAQGGVEAGLTREQAMEYAIQTVIGSAKLLQATGDTPENLKNAVCSPGGSTIEGVHVLENRELKQTVTEAIAASYKRNIELGSQ